MSGQVKDDAGKAGLDAKKEGEQTIKLAIGAALAMMGTLLAIAVFPESLGAYHPAVTLLGLALCCAYAVYLNLFEFWRLRRYLLNYLTAVSATVLAPIFLVPLLQGLGEMTAGVRFDIIANLIPVLAAFSSILSTHLLGSAPDIVVARKEITD